ncbi:uncharacterized protein [Drosophila suzukii]|uniref:RNase H type-1 domain-containing protein n=1 Tax=Drosophila suzukii TaxID=28584 RepID=A0ABM4TW15_DROSZ
MVVFIPKAGKASHTMTKDFRPISLTSFLLKSFERLIGLHIRSVMDSKQLSAAQHAYSKGKSTESALHAVVSQIEKSLNHKEYALAAFLDIEGAFNNVLPTAITESLTDLGVEIQIVELIHKLLMSKMVTSILGISTQTRLPDHCSVFQAEVFAIIEALMLLNDANCQNKLINIYSDSQAAIRLPDHCSVFQAEVFAIIEALMLLNDANCQNKLINIYSDSQAAIRSIISTNTNSHTISNCRKSLHEMALQFKIYLIWVPGHRNITGNCIADELARHGTTVPLLPDKENIALSHLSPDMANHRREENFGTIKTKPYRVRNGNTSVNRPLVGWHTRKQIKRAPKRFLQKLQGRGGRGNGETPVLFLPGPEQI